MLQKDAVQPATLELLKKIMGIPDLKAFNLAGGTALALQLGHRLSLDLDFFGNVNFNPDEILNVLSEIASPVILSQSKSILILNIQNIKVDFVNYRYPLLNPPYGVEGIRLLTYPDIAAMKLAAIAGRGKKRDFIDLYFSLQQYSLKELTQFYTKKYHDGSEFIVVKSLMYFDDAEKDENPIMLKKIDWISIKDHIGQIVTNYLKNM